MSENIEGLIEKEELIHYSGADAFIPGMALRHIPEARGMKKYSNRVVSLSEIALVPIAQLTFIYNVASVISNYYM
ncbi:MAG: hypothetical protein WCK90_00910 [archaeon]